MNSARHHLPQHPLPREIQEMDRDDTVCHFCGVSYLIHSEIKALQEQLDAAHKEIERLISADERERRLKDEVQMLTVKSADLLHKWEMEVARGNEHGELISKRNETIALLTEKNETYRNDFVSEKIKNEKLAQQASRSASVTRKLRASLKELRNDVAEMNASSGEQLTKYKENWKAEKSLIVENIAQFVKLCDSCVEDKKLLEREVTYHSVKCKQLSKTIATKNENEKHLTETFSRCLVEHQKRLTSYKDQMNKLRGKCSALEGNHLKKIQRVKEKMQRLSSHMESIAKNRSVHQDNLASSMNRFKEENSRLQEERSHMVNAHQHQLKQLRDSFLEKLAEAEGKPAKLDEKIKDLEEKFASEKQELVENHESMLQTMCENHEVEKKQINQSKEKYRLEVRKLEDKFAAQQKKFSGEKSQLLKEMTESFDKVSRDTELQCAQMNEEREKHAKITRKLEQQMEAMQAKFQESMRAQMDQHDEDKKTLTASFDQKLAALQRLAEEEKRSPNIIPHEKEELTRRIKELEDALRKSKDVIEERSRCLNENLNEMNSLRDCVRRECEERFELTELLAEARTELLSMQRFSNSPKKLSSHPLVYNNNNNNNNNQPQPQQVRSNIKLEELSTASRTGSITSLVNSSASVKSQTSPRKNSGSSYSKNKLKISLKNS